ncbi:alpha/beta hydrolase [Pseudomonas sp. GD03860]|uniref:alpha/beta fold hydrolase n=1 Tax=Pseudomonas TaxID=286 RepID=UPI0023637B84|nr:MULTISPECIES: alpha/beta hydrolase [Pseudomonas]MDD2058521.1 alpha/beta hydrolase [Pseudomonas putida]MDH0640663.1 alpha/beta hydrolase [Pseudomonas sp. GD03860]
MQDVQHQILSVNGIELSLYSSGPEHGRPVWLLHGFPESWYSWRRQIPALAAAGFRVLVPEMRGYGQTSAPQAVEEYDLITLCADIQAAMDALGQTEACVVGHDWGAPVAYHLGLLEPERVKALVTLSVPYGGRPRRSPLELLHKAFENRFHYMLYFQHPGVAEAELNADIANSLRRIQFGRGASESFLQDKPADSRLFDGLGDVPANPPWCSEADFEVYVRTFARGFDGPLNWYRNFDRSWARSADLAGRQILQPTLFLLGEDDPIGRIESISQERMPSVIPDLEQHRLAECGHWTQNEQPQAVNALVLDFLARRYPARGDRQRQQ